MSDSSSLPSDNNIIINTNKKPKKSLLLFFSSTIGCFSPYPTTKENKILQPSERSEEMKVTGDDSHVERMKRSVKEINFGGVKEKEVAAVEIKRLAKTDVGTRRLLAEFGVIASLVTMLVEAKEDHCRRLAVDALIEMANGTFRNKARMVEAGLLSQLPHLIHVHALVKDQQFLLLLLSISSLAKTQFPITSSHILTFLIKVLNADETDEESKLICIATLYNLSTKLDNTKAIVSSGAVRSLLTMSTNKKASEGVLAILGNLMPSMIGKKAIEDEPLVPNVFIQILAWDDKPKCQEIASYLLMVIAHRSRIMREKMSKHGIVPVLLEVALLGSPIARKRSLQLLQWFKDERQMRMVLHSGPQERRIIVPSSPIGEKEIKECRMAVKSMVTQSLAKNMELIMKRANGFEGSSGLKALVVSSSSKSLPY